MPRLWQQRIALVALTLVLALPSAVAWAGAGAAAAEGPQAPQMAKAEGSMQLSQTRRGKQPRRRAVKGKRNRARALARAQARSRGLLAYLVPGLLFGTFFGLAWHHRRQRRLELSQALDVRMAPTKPNFEARPVKLEEGPRIDPATIGMEDDISPLGGRQEIAESETRIHKGEVDVGGPITAHGIRLRTDDAPAPKRRRPGRNQPAPEQRHLPVKGELSQHFPAVQGEKVLWQGSYKARFYGFGDLAVTSGRLIAAYTVEDWRWLPPHTHREQRRHQVGLRHMVEFRRESESQGWWIVAGLLPALWYPVGCIVAVMCIAGYALMPKPVLAIWTKDGRRRSYPLSSASIEQSLDALARARALRSKRRRGTQTKSGGAA